MGDMRSPNSLFGLIGRGGAFRLHVPSTKLPIHYMVDSKTLIRLAEMGNDILNQNQATWANTDTRINPQTFYEPTLNRKIAIREMGGRSV